MLTDILITYLIFEYNLLQLIDVYVMSIFIFVYNPNKKYLKILYPIIIIVIYY